MDDPNLTSPPTGRINAPVLVSGPDRMKRESGENPELPRSGERERVPPKSTLARAGKSGNEEGGASGRCARESEDLPATARVAGRRDACASREGRAAVLEGVSPPAAGFGLPAIET